MLSLNFSPALKLTLTRPFLASEAKAEQTKRYAAALNRDHHRSASPRLASSHLTSPRRLGFCTAVDLAVPAMDVSHAGSSVAGEAPTTGEHRMGTTIVGVCYEGGVVLGADSRTSTGTPFRSYRSMYAAGDPIAGRGRFGEGWRSGPRFSLGWQDWTNWSIYLAASHLVATGEIRGIWILAAILSLLLAGFENLP
jgi:hypothetical protein